MRNELLPHQQRVVDERNSLYDKTIKLNEFVGSSGIFENLEISDQEDLKIQLDIMFQYLEVLDKRIKKFKP